MWSSTITISKWKLLHERHRYLLLQHLLLFLMWRISFEKQESKVSYTLSHVFPHLMFVVVKRKDLWLRRCLPELAKNPIRRILECHDNRLFMSDWYEYNNLYLMMLCTFRWNFCEIEMKFSYKFSNLFGTVYRGGDLIFTPDGNTVISPVGNKITLFDLKNHKSETLPVESRFSFNALDLSPNGVR